jgi:GT2 family glycosyltransferase
MNELFISVIIVTRNRYKKLDYTISKFLEQDYNNFEIIVVDNNSDNIDYSILQAKYPFVKFILLPVNIHLQAFDFGAKEAKGEILWRTDDDSNPRDKDAFIKINNIFKKFSDIHIIGTEIILPLIDNQIQQWYQGIYDANNIPEKGLPTNHFMGCGAAIRREVYDKIGGFWGFGLEEVEFSTRAIINGFNIRFFPNIVTEHYPSYTKDYRIFKWLIIAKQQMRYHSKYFRQPKAFFRFLTILFFQNFEALTLFIPLSKLIEGNLSMLYSYFHTRNFEKIKLTKEMERKITFNENLFTSMFIYNYLRFKNYFKKITKKE